MSETFDKINGLARELVIEAREAEAEYIPTGPYAGAEAEAKVAAAYMKKDAGKPTQPELLDAEWLIGVSAVLKFGAEKYAPNRWREGMAWSRVYGSLLRHLFSFWAGEELDPETGLSHLWHASCCLMFLSSYQYGMAYREHDDRPNLGEL